MYSEKVMDHFKNPRNMGEIKDADGVGEVGNPTCGDLMKIYIKVEKKDGIEYIKDIKFQTFGCAAAIANSSILTEMAKGKTLDEAENISKSDILEELGEMPKIKYHCSILAQDGLKAAIRDYRKQLNTTYN